MEGSKRMRKNYKKDINVLLIMETLPYSSERLRLYDISHIQLQTIMLDDHIVHRLFFGRFNNSIAFLRQLITFSLYNTQVLCPSCCMISLLILSRWSLTF